MSQPFDFLIIGAGFSGLTMAERITTCLGRTCLLVEKRDHLGGNAYDSFDEAGLLIHNYGPHYFRTNSAKIREYLSAFTGWHPVDYQILSHARGCYWNFPINLNTFEQFLGRASSTEEMEDWLKTHRIPIDNPANSEEVILSQVGREFYELFFKGYTIKQWRRHPRDLDASVCGRIPVRTNRDDRYLREEFQALPDQGYTQMFRRMVAACGNKLEIRLNTDYRSILGTTPFAHLVATGPIDEFFDFRHGRLPYRSLRFERESFGPKALASRRALSGKEGFWQPAMQVNYPNDEAFTRIVEIKHATGQKSPSTTIVREYPHDYAPGGEPYYPIPAPDATAIYRKYQQTIEEVSQGTQGPRSATSNDTDPLLLVPRTSFIGRLATYRYYNMDQVVGMALAEFEKIRRRFDNP